MVNGEEVEIGAGVVSAGKHWAEHLPEQYIYIYTDSDKRESEKCFDHDDSKGIFFKEFQDNGRGWEVVYDSREHVDRTKTDYPFPDWVENGDGRIPDDHVKYEDDKVKINRRGWIG